MSAAGRIVAAGPGVLIAVVAGSFAYAEDAPNLAEYDCTRAADDSSATGEELQAEGYEIATRARFGDVNLMMINPKKSGAIANCFKRQKSQN